MKKFWKCAVVAGIAAALSGAACIIKKFWR